MKKRILTLALALVMLCGILPCGASAAGTPTFSDVKENDWFVNDVKYVYQNGLMGGTGNGAFSPNEGMTRGMLVTMLHRMEGSPAAELSSFWDVGPNAYYAVAVGWAAANNIVNGSGENSFMPDNFLNREQFAVILFRYAGCKGYDVSAKAELSGFPDAGSVSGYARDAVAWANAAGLINGTGDGRLAPLDSADRVQGAAIMRRFCETVAKRAPAENPPEFVPAEDLTAVFTEMSGWEFILGTGMGNWGTFLGVAADGSFTGRYYDMDTIGGDGYNSTIRTCSFSGRFTDVKKISDYEYSMRLESLNMDKAPGQTWIEDGVKYISADAYGMEAGEFRVYLKGKSVSELPKGFKDWTSGMINKQSKLPFCGIYNTTSNTGFYSRVKDK